ncbi:hypothetical protein Bca101_055676 [Brassica carinata]
MNPEEQDIKYLIVTLPKICNMEERVIGADLGLGIFHFDFDEEEDIKTVLKMQLFHFDYWMISLVPPTFHSIGDAIGETKAVDLDYGRVQVVVDSFKELTFETIVDFTGGEYYEGEEVPVSLKYEKLFGYLHTCYSLCHKKEKWPLTTTSSEKAKKIRDRSEGRHDDRARSYKKAWYLMTMGRNKRRQGRNGSIMERVREKMFKEADLKWVRVAEREKKRYHHTRKDYRGEEEGSRHRNSRREHIRAHHQEDCTRNPGGQRAHLNSRNEVHTDAREEGEIRGSEKPQLQDEKCPFEYLEKGSIRGLHLPLRISLGLFMGLGYAQAQRASHPSRGLGHPN